jgi:UDP-N-acetylmuramate dehydrogenase
VSKKTNEHSFELVRKHCGDYVRENEPLGPRTTWRIGGPAKLFAEPRTLPELSELCNILQSENLNAFFLGFGSNVLVSDEGVQGVVIHPRGDFSKIEFENGEIVAGPSTRLMDMTIFAANHGLSGLEQLSGIPGSVGGGLYMNAGAFRSTISDKLARLELLKPNNRITVLRRREISFGYRKAPELREGIILRSFYRLDSIPAAPIWTAMREAWKLRRAKQPLNVPSAGSIFKRPKGDFSGRLIEAVQAKGLRIGDAVVSERHANFFINAGHATAGDMAALIRKVRTLVFRKYDVVLEPEVKPVGFKEDPFEIEG